MKVEVKTGVRRRTVVDRFGAIGDRLRPVVEVIIDGIVCIHECDTPEDARTMAVRLAYALGIE